ncbi:MSCRAMM family protein [Anaerococcus lactolyticus]|uniref:MSCRAMM family protein n=1 Tax=Anaerococcus lactolyticus TaxID=33032 RepID=UPI00288B65B7|nr:SpaA isopeptide-forming pilin-related protein [Anaerococcus lactolyticus]
MKNILKSRYISFILALFMVVGVFLPQGRVFADKGKGKYKIDLQIDVKDRFLEENENMSGKVLRPSGRQVRVYKLNINENLSKDQMLDLASKYDSYTAEKINELRENKTIGKVFLSEKSKLYYEGKSYDEIWTDKIKGFDYSNLSEQILIEGLSEGYYLIKETEQSSEIESEKLVTNVVKLPDSGMEKNTLRIYGKQTRPVSKKSIKLIKVDSDNKDLRLNKVKFELYQKIKDGDKEKSVPVKVTGEKGKYFYDETKGSAIALETWDKGEIVVENLPEGTYYFKEIEPIEGYNYPGNSNKGKESDPVQPGKEVTVTNAPFSILKKVDDKTGEPLYKAKFKLFAKDGKPVKFKMIDGNYTYDPSGDLELVATSKQGSIYVKDLPNGDYYFMEVEAPDGYYIKNKEEKYHFAYKDGQMKATNGDKYLVIGNPKIHTDKNPKTPTGGFNFVKIDDSKDEKRLAGARFVLMKLDEKTNKYERVVKDGKQITLESGNNGEFRVDGLEYGRYAIREEAAPVNYYIDNPLTYFDVDAASISLPAKKIVNKPYKPVITSRDNTTVTKYVPTNVTTVIKNIVKTGDVKIIIMAIAGLILLTMGIKLVNSSEKLQMA